MAAKHRDPAAVVQPDQRAIAGAEKMAQPIIGRQGQIACDSERQAVWQEEAVAPLEKHRLISTLNRDPACARGHGVAFDQDEGAFRVPVSARPGP